MLSINIANGTNCLTSCKQMRMYFVNHLDMVQLWWCMVLVAAHCATQAGRLAGHDGSKQARQAGRLATTHYRLVVVVHAMRGCL